MRSLVGLILPLFALVACAPGTAEPNISWEDSGLEEPNHSNRANNILVWASNPFSTYAMLSMEFGQEGQEPGCCGWHLVRNFSGYVDYKTTSRGLLFDLYDAGYDISPGDIIWIRYNVDYGDDQHLCMEGEGLTANTGILWMNVDWNVTTWYPSDSERGCSAQGSSTK